METKAYGALAGDKPLEPLNIAHAMGTHVVAFTTSNGRREDAHALGADEVMIPTNADEMAQHVNSFEFILNTAAASLDLYAYTALLKRDGTITLVGWTEHAHHSPMVGALICQ